MSACTISPYIKTSDGKVVESKLFNDLFSTFKNRGKAWKYYGIATNPKFLKSIKEQISFDSNGEITLDSFFRVASVRTQGDQAIALLEKSLGLKTEEYSYDEAIATINSFNRHNTENPGYMATMVETKDGNYAVHIVQRNSQNKEYLKQTIKDKLIKEKITEHLNRAGVAVNLTAPSSHYLVGQNIEKTANGLCELIDFCVDDSSQVFGEEAGHFVIAAATNTPLYNRLMSLLEKSDLHEIFSEDEIRSAYRTDNPIRELAGQLVGKSIHKQLEQSPIKNLIDRVFNSVKKFFAKMSSNQLKKDLLEINEIATGLAESFIGDNIEGSLASALSYLEKREHSELTRADKALTTAIQKLDQLVANLKNIDETWLAGVIQDIIIDATTQESSAEFARAAHDGIVSLVMQLSQLLQAEREAAEAKGVSALTLASNPVQFIQEVSKVAPTIVKMRTIIQALTGVMNAIEQTVQDNQGLLRETTLDVGGIEVNPHFFAHYNNLRQLLGLSGYATTTQESEANKEGIVQSFAEVILTAEKRIIMGHLKFLLGADYIHHVDKLLFQKPEGSSQYKEKAHDTSLEDLLEYISGTNGLCNGWLWNLLGTCANSPDVVSQLYDQALQQSDMDAHKATELDAHKFEAHRKKLNKIGLSNKDQHIFFERTKDGKLTNNLITDIRLREDDGTTSVYTVRWALFEEEQEELEKTEYKKWYQANKENLEKLSKTAQYHLWMREYSDIRTKWLKENAVWDYSKKCHCPNPHVKDENGDYKYRYDNPLTAEQKQWLQELHEILDDIKSRVEGHMPVHRAPQFSATFANMIRNKVQEHGNVITGTAAGLWHWVVTAIKQENDPEFFGSENTFNDDDKKPKSSKDQDKQSRDSIFVYSQTLRRIPLFGINKIKDTSRLSTDLISSSIAFAAMANKNSAHSKIEYLIRMGMDYRAHVAKRQYENLEGEEDAHAKRMDLERIMHRLTTQVDKLMFGVGMKRTKLGHKSNALNLMARALSMFSTKKFLGGNVSGAAVNATTGTLELYKEAFSGEHFNTEELHKAMRTYFQAAGFAIGDHFTGNDTSKLSLFSRRYLISSSDEFKYMNRGSSGERVAQVLWDDFFMLPYSMGESFMQTVPFIALAQKKILYKQDGTAISLWDALTVQDDVYQEYDQSLLDFKDVNTGQKTLTLPLLFDTKTGGQKYDELLDDADKFANKGLVKISDLNPTTVDYLKRHNITIATNKDAQVTPYAVISKALKREAKDLTYNDSKDAKFQRKARNITNKMHGVYNSTDKTYAQRTLYGSMLLTMRGYALGLVEKNYGVTGYRVAEGQETEGVMRTLGKVIKHALYNEDALYGETGEETAEGNPIYKRGWRSSAGRRLLWYSSLGILFQKEKAAAKLKEAGVAADISEDAAPGAAFQYHNLRRALFGRLASYLLALLWFLGVAGEDDEDEQYEYWSGMVSYFASRVFFEQIAFTSGTGVVHEVNSTNLMMPAGLSAAFGTLETLELAMGSLIFDTYDPNSLFAKRYRYKSYKGEKNVAKAEVRLKRSIPYYREADRMSDWHEARKSYLWFRNKSNM